jgi:glycosyltransferase involved in cell wall biosynthesis
MRIIYLHQYFITPDMPGGTRSYEMGRRLTAMGHDVQMVTSDRIADPTTAPEWRSSDVAGMRVHAFPVPYSNRMPYRERLSAFMRFAWRSAVKAASLGGDVVFATSTPLTIALPGSYAAWRSRIPMVLEVRDLWPELPIAVGALSNPASIRAAEWLERFAYARSAHIVALSPDMKAGIARIGYPEERVSVIPNACDRELFDAPTDAVRALRRQHDWLGHRPLVVYTGTLGKLNGVSYLADVAAATARIDPEIRFAVLGDGMEGELVRRRAAELGVLDRTFFMMGVVPKVAVPRWLGAATFATSLFIDLEAMWANSANKFFDALASGTPVAINYGGWQAKLLYDTGAGVRLDARDAAHAARALVARIRDEPWIVRAHEAARRLAATRFDRDRLAEQLEQILVRVARNGRPLSGATPVQHRRTVHMLAKVAT